MKQFSILLFLGISNFITAQTFENIDAVLPNVELAITAFADFDNDGDLDLYLSGSSSDVDDTNEGGLYIYDSGAYTLSTISNLPVLHLGAARWGDIDNDGDLDILLQGTNYDFGAFTDLFINNADGTFTALEIPFPQTYQGEADLSDVNNDGFIDVAIAGYDPSDTYITTIYKNNGDTSFTELSGMASIPGLVYGRIAFADYNNDNYSDFILSGLNSGDFYVYLFTNNQDETFTKETGIPFFQCWLGDTAWADYNNDGNIDLLISGTGGSGTERHSILYKNNGDGSFTDSNADLPGVSHSALKWADFDNDGDLDILITGIETSGNSIYSIYNNEGSDVFTESTTAVLNIANWGDADVGDIDGDGKIDLVISGYNPDVSAGRSTVYKNTTSTTGIDHLNLDQIVQIFPNPAIDKKITINYTSSDSDSATKEIIIYNLAGVKVFQKEILNTTSQLNLSFLKSGIYLMKLKSNNKIMSKKLILK